MQFMIAVGGPAKRRRGYTSASIVRVTPVLSIDSRHSAGLSGEHLAAVKGGDRGPKIVLAGLGPWGFSPRTSIRGHPRLGAVATKSWVRGSSPRKTTENRLLRVQQDHRARKLSTDTPASLRGAAGDEAISMVWACEVPEIASLRSQ